MLYDYSKLKGRIVEKCGTQRDFAKAMNLSYRSISLKLNNKVAWSQDDIQKAMEVLSFEPEEIQNYFFAIKVQ